MSATRVMDVDEFVDNAPFGAFHIRVLAISTIMMMIDGYDLYLVGWILPALSEDYGVPRTDLASVLIIQQIGMLIGGYFIAPMADRIGRRGLLLVGVIIVALSCFATIFATNVTQFTACRVVTGMFAGAIVPNLIAMTSEMAPKKFRGTMPTIVLCGAMGGALIGAAMQAYVLEDYGWRGAFWVGAILPALMLPVIFFFLPESLRYLVRKKPNDPQVAKIARQISTQAEAPESFFEKETGSDQHKSGIATDILGRSQLLKSLLLWAAFMCSFNFISLFASWSTTIFRDMVGLSWQEVALTTTIHTGFGIVGTLSIGLLIDRLGFKRIVPMFMIGGAVSVVLVGVTGTGLAMFTALAAMSLFQVGGQAGLASLAPTIYPPKVKATGVGWAYGAGRIGAMLAPLIGAALLNAGFGSMTVFSAMGIPLLLAGLFVFILAPSKPAEGKV